jgi:cell division protein FtsZ
MAQQDEMMTSGVARVVVAGVGGAGGNAIRGMMRSQVRGVEFLAINTDAQALARVDAPRSLRIGEKLTRGLGAGGNPEIGLRAAEESRDAIRTALAGADMLFITAGMGGGTGTGASPAVAMTARELGVLTVAIVSTPFVFEGEPRRRAAERGASALREHVDTLIVVPNERLLRVGGKSMRMSEAFAVADDVLRQGVQAISDLIAIPGHINLDFADVRAVMAEAGSALMSTGQASGDDRAHAALQAALTNPMLDVDITGARALLVNITAGPDLMLHEAGDIVEALRQKVHADANILFGTVEDPAHEGQIKVTLVATGFDPRVTRRAFAGAHQDVRPAPRQDAAAASRGVAPVSDGRAPAASAVTDGAPASSPSRMPALPRESAEWDAPRVASGAGRSAPAAARVLPDEPDAPRVGQPRVRPASQATEPSGQPAEGGFRGIDLPAFLRGRR